MPEFKHSLSEGDLLQTLLSQVTPHQCFMIGEVMGIMSKGDQTRIYQLEAELSRLKEAHNMLKVDYAQLKRESNGRKG